MIRGHILQKHSFNFHFEKWAQATAFSVGHLICSGLSGGHGHPGFCQQPGWKNGLGCAFRLVQGSSRHCPSQTEHLPFRPWERLDCISPCVSLQMGVSMTPTSSWVGNSCYRRDWIETSPKAYLTLIIFNCLKQCTGSETVSSENLHYNYCRLPWKSQCSVLHWENILEWFTNQASIGNYFL